jgi:hypothetical protein
LRQLTPHYIKNLSKLEQPYRLVPLSDSIDSINVKKRDDLRAHEALRRIQLQRKLLNALAAIKAVSSLTALFYSSTAVPDKWVGLYKDSYTRAKKVEGNKTLAML